MALTRAALKGMGVTEKEIIDVIMEAHGETVEAAKEKAKETAETAAQKTIDSLQIKVSDLQSKVDNIPTDTEDWMEKYNAEVTAHKATVDGYKAEKTTSAQNKALREALKAAGANEKLIPLLVDKLDRATAKFDGDTEKGFTIKNADDILKPVKEQFSEVFGTVETLPANPATPPRSEPAKPTGNKDMNSFIRGVAE